MERHQRLDIHRRGPFSEHALGSNRSLGSADHGEGRDDIASGLQIRT